MAHDLPKEDEDVVDVPRSLQLQSEMKDDKTQDILILSPGKAKTGDELKKEKEARKRKKQKEDRHTYLGTLLGPRSSLGHAKWSHGLRME